MELTYYRVNFRVILSLIRHFFPPVHKAISSCKRFFTTKGPLVTISSGTLRGHTSKNANNEVFYSFQGIPYAKPPLGELRFKAPQPVEPWIGIRNVDYEGNCCICRHPVLRNLIGDDDCLYLNVYTPGLPEAEDNHPKPVMFWIHGGGFTSGSGSSEVYGPQFLLTEDIVLVTINYRLGVLGFFSLEDPELGVPGNAGLKDIVMALTWVQENIKHFGGDPNNVTVFGESAGAAAAHYLILTPLAKGLFHKSILQSGCALNVWARGRNYAQDLAKELGLKTGDNRELLRVLQKMRADQMYLAAEKIPDPFLACKIRPHGPVIEKKSPDAFLSEEPLDIIKSGKYNHVPIMIGYTDKEGILSEILQKPKPFKPITDFELSIPYFLKLEPGSAVSKMVAQQIKEFYYGDEEPTTSNKDNFYMLETDNFFAREILETIKHHKVTSSNPIFLYRVSIDTHLNVLKRVSGIREPGTCHGDELGYLFSNLLEPHIKPGSDEDIAVKRFVKLWTTFAKYGDPNPKEIDPYIDLSWEPVENGNLNYLDIGKDLTKGVNPEHERMTFWGKILNMYPVNKL